MKAARFLAAAFLIAIIVGGWGYAAGKFGVFPGEQLTVLVTEVVNFFRGSNKSAIDTVTMHRQEYKLSTDPLYHGHDAAREIPMTGNEGKFFVYDVAFKDEGYLLVSRFSWAAGQAVVELIRLADQRLMHRWVPPVKEILAQDGLPEDKDCNNESGYRAQSPLLFPDGGIAFTSGDGAVVKIDKDGKLKWLTKGLRAHHSIERDKDGNLYTPIVITESDGSIHEFSCFREDGYAVVSPNGEVLHKYSFAKILADNGQIGLVLGVGELIYDRFHLNDAQPINTNAGILREGDVGLSSRGLSTVLVYRPSENKIIAMSVGPWLLQHDVTPLPDGTLSVFNNNDTGGTVRGAPEKNDKPPLSGVSEIIIWDPERNTFTRPYQAVMEKLGVFSASQGRAKILENGDAFIEEPWHTRALRISPEKARWIFVNQKGNSTAAGALHWSRYLTKDAVPNFLQ